MLGDSITTDHISPAGSIKQDSPAGTYLIEHGVAAPDFNSYGARRGNHEVMMRGTFANIRIKNLHGARRRRRRHRAPARRRADVDLRRRDAVQGARACRWWSSPARNTAPAPRATGRPRARCLLGVRAVIAESFERIHRSNLVGMGVLPLQFKPGENAETFALKGHEELTIVGLTGALAPRQDVTVGRGACGRHPHGFRGHGPPRHACRDQLLPERRDPAHRAAQDAGRLLSRSSRARGKETTCPN